MASRTDSTSLRRRCAWLARRVAVTSAMTSWPIAARVPVALLRSSITLARVIGLIVVGAVTVCRVSVRMTMRWAMWWRPHNRASADPRVVFLAGGSNERAVATHVVANRLTPRSARAAIIVTSKTLGEASCWDRTPIRHRRDD